MDFCQDSLLAQCRGIPCVSLSVLVRAFKMLLNQETLSRCCADHDTREGGHREEDLKTWVQRASDRGC